MKGILVFAGLVVASILLSPLIGALPVLADKYLRKFEQLPRIARWILCWPLSFAITVVVWVSFFLGTWWFVPRFLMHIIAPPLCHGVFLSCVYSTVPRGKFAIVLTFIVLRSLCLVVLAIVTVATLLDVAELVTFDVDFWGGTLGEVGVLCVSVGLLRYIMETRREECSPAYVKGGLQRPEIQADRENTAHTTDEALDCHALETTARHHCSV